MPTSQADDEVTRSALAAKGGDRAAAAAFISATQPDLRRFLGHLADAGDVDDLSQETYLRAMRSLPGFDARSSARTWLFAIARRVAADQIRLSQRRPRRLNTPDWQGAVERSRQPTPRLDEGVVLRRLLAELAPDRREAFVATQVLGLSYQEAAAVCDCPVGTIRSRVARAREDLVEAINADRTDGRSRRAAR